jgi:hypothetical protein
MSTTMNIERKAPRFGTRMRGWSYASQRCVSRFVWWPLTYIAQAVHPAPILSGIIVFLLLSQVGQMHEIYLAYLEPSNLAYLKPSDEIWRALHIVLAAGALALLSAALYFANYSLSDVNIDMVWSEHSDVDRDNKLRAFRNVAGLVAAALPWAGVGYGIWLAGRTARGNLEKLNVAAGLLGGSLEKANTEIQLLTKTLDMLCAPLLVVALSGLAVAFLLQVFRRSAWLRCSTLALIALLFLAAFVVPIFMGGEQPTLPGVNVFRRIGPLAMVVLDVLLVFACVGVVALLSRAVGIPIVTLVIAIALVAVLFDLKVPGIALLIAVPCATVAILALLSARWRLLVLSTVVFGLSVGLRWPNASPPEQELPDL